MNGVPVVAADRYIFGDTRIDSREHGWQAANERMTRSWRVPVPEAGLVDVEC